MFLDWTDRWTWPAFANGGLLYLCLTGASLVVLCGACLFASADAQAEPGPATASATMVSEAGDWIGQGTDRLFDLPGEVSASGDASAVSVGAELGPEDFRFDFRAPEGRQLERGEYAANANATRQWAGLNVDGEGRGCNGDHGRFIVKDIHLGSSGAVERFWALYEQACGSSGGPELFGEVKFGEPLTGTTLDPAPASVAWPVTAIGRRSVVVPVTFSAAEGATAIQSVTLAGPDAGDFNLENDGCRRDSLQPGAQCELEVVAEPTGPGIRKAEVVLTDEAGSRTTVPLEVDTEPPTPPLMSGDAATVVSEAGDWIGGGRDLLFDEPGSVTATGEPNSVDVRAEADGERFSFEFEAPWNQDLAIGEYAGAGSSARRASPGLQVDGTGTGCADTGRFIVKDIHFSESGQLERFWALYEQHCQSDGGTEQPAVFGEVRFGEPQPVSPELTAPTAVDWPRTAVGQTSDQVPITVGAGESGGHVTSVALEGSDAGEFKITADECEGVTLAPRRRCDLAVAVAPRATGERTAQLVITDQSGVQTVVPLSVSTEAPPPPLMSSDSATLVSEPGDWIGGGTDRLFDEPGAVTLSGNHQFVEVQAEYGNEDFHMEFAAPYGQELAVGEYTKAKRIPFQRRAAGLSVGGDGNGCNNSLGRFIIKDIHFGSTGAVERLWAMYEQHCEANNRPPSFGEVRVGEPPSEAPEVIAPSSVEWPPTKVRRRSVDVPVTVGAGEGGAEIASVSLEGEDASDFTIADEECSGVALAPRRRCELALAATPKAAGPLSALLVITDTSGARTSVPLAVLAKR